MKLSQSVTYAVHAALRLAAEDGSAPVSCGRLAREGKMPERFLLQILRDLSKKGILQSTRGGGGGFMLRRTADKITMLELIEAIDGPIAAGLPTNLTFPTSSGHVIRNTLDQITEITRRQLADLTLSQLVSANGCGGNGRDRPTMETAPADELTAEQAVTGPPVAEPVPIAQRSVDHPVIPAPRHLSAVATGASIKQ